MTSQYFCSVIIPTYNREKLLPITLDSFLKQNYPSNLYEIIVVNNNSTDGTQALLERYARENSNLRIAFEPRQGVHYARNLAARFARGEILYYTDDDMIADPELLTQLLAIFERDPKVGSATGRVLPRWDVPPPDWVPRLMMNGLLSLQDHGPGSFVEDEDFGVYSCHQAMRREAFFDAGGYNPENTAGEWIGDGETGLNKKIGELGYKFGYVGSSIIQHIIPASRMTQAYLNKRMANQGNCASYANYRAQRPDRLGLVIGIFGYLVGFHRSWLRAFYHYAQLRNLDPIRMGVAWSYYWLNRAKYDYRLLTDPQWRALVLRMNWLEES